MKNSLLIFLVGVMALAGFVYIRKKNTPKPISPEIKGLILPHHDLAKELFHSSLKKLQSISQPETIVIYGTNHYFPTSQTYTTSTSIKNEFQLSEEILADDERIQKEHSIQTVAPYLKEYYPNAKIIPIIVSSRYENIEELNTVIEYFISIFGSQRTLYIASVDFAHNVSLDEGMRKNQESIGSISEMNMSEILEYQDDHLDSPLAIITLLLTMKQLEANSWETWYSSHGALITNNLDLNGTSYVIGTFSKRKY